MTIDFLRKSLVRMYDHKKIAVIQLEGQDEYGERLKSSTTSDLPLNVTVSFAEVPDKVIL